MMCRRHEGRAIRQVIMNHRISELVRTSSKLVVKRTPDGRNLPRTYVSSAERPPPKLESICSRGFLPRPNVPDPYSQSFSRSYGSVLPTSLIYILLSTRGCSPWRPAAVMSTTWRETNLPRADFQGSSGALRTAQRCAALPAVKPYLRTNRFQGDGPSRRKENSSQGPRRRLRLRLRCRESSTSRRRNVNRLPFREVTR